ncbi:MAG: T9SS type A sorting domain-containing protein [Bacteroidetes bacterium]|nr:MAG: T9SS type A sorting domain-containing protein [Bacteroidota bacterium]
MKLKLRCIFYPLFVLMMSLSEQNVVSAQARIVIGTNTAVYMRMSNGTQSTPICLVLDNASVLGISCCNACGAGPAGACPASGSLSWIVSEHQYNYVVWRGITATGTPSYLVPLGTTTATVATGYLPVTFKETAGTGTVVAISTWPSASNNTPWAGISDGLPGLGTTTVAPVTQMNINATDGSVGSVIDRWWDIDVNAATTADVTFSYRGAENTMTVSPTGLLAAQHWTGSLWNDGKGGAGGTKTPTAQSGNQGAATYTAVAAGLTEFTPFILVTDVAPLPVTWLDVSAECNKGDVTVKWSTASEQNSDYFTVERSYDGTNFTDIANVLAAGQSSAIKNYSFVDEDPIPGVSYYRIRETDFNSSFIISAQMTMNGCSNDDIFIFGSEGGISVNIDAAAEGKYVFELYDVLGQNLMNETKTVPAGSNHLKLFVSNIASAMYVVKVYSGSNAVSKKVFIRSAYTQ